MGARRRGKKGSEGSDKRFEKHLGINKESLRRGGEGEGYRLRFMAKWREK